MEGKELALLLKKHPEAVKDPKRLRNMLYDWFPTEQREIRLLEWALELDILREIQADPIDMPLLLRLSRRMMDEFSVQEDKAAWAVSIWSYAYGFGVLGKPLPAKPAPKAAPQPAPAVPVKAPPPAPVQPPKPVQQPRPVQQPPRPVQQAPKPVQQQAKPVQRPAPPQIRPAVPSDISHFELKSTSRIILHNAELESLRKTVSSGKALVKYVGPGGDVVIPQGVTGISDWAFSIDPRYVGLGMYGRTHKRPAQVRSVVIPQGVTAIGWGAFDGCSDLQSITIPRGATEIGDGAFRGCSNLRDITFPQGMECIRDSLFDGCSSLQNVTIPQGVVSIGNYAFRRCSSLQSVIIPQGVTEIGAYAFSGCSSLLKVVIPQGVKTIAGEAFSDCSRLQSVVLPQGVCLFDDVFKGCPDLRRPGGELDTADMSHFVFDSTCHVLKKYIGPGGDVVIPRGVLSISGNAFSNHATLTSVTIPPNVQLGPEVFWGCGSLECVTLSRGTLSIPRSAFQCCYKLQEVELPEGLTEIGFRAFCNCDSLREIWIPKSVTKIGRQAFLRHKKFLFNSPVTLRAPAGSYAQQYARENGLRFRAV